MKQRYDPALPKDFLPQLSAQHHCTASSFYDTKNTLAMSRLKLDRALDHAKATSRKKVMEDRKWKDVRCFRTAGSVLAAFERTVRSWGFWRLRSFGVIAV